MAIYLLFKNNNMKRILILIVLVGFFGVSAVQAQGYTAEGIRLNIGTGLWAVNPPLMPIHAGMEFGITEEISLGSILAGGYMMMDQHIILWFYKSGAITILIH